MDFFLPQASWSALRQWCQPNGPPVKTKLYHTAWCWTKVEGWKFLETINIQSIWLKNSFKTSNKKTCWHDMPFWQFKTKGAHLFWHPSLPTPLEKNKKNSFLKDPGSPPFSRNKKPKRNSKTLEPAKGCLDSVPLKRHGFCCWILFVGSCCCWSLKFRFAFLLGILLSDAFLFSKRKNPRIQNKLVIFRLVFSSDPAEAKRRNLFPVEEVKAVGEGARIILRDLVVNLRWDDLLDPPPILI